MQRDRWPFIPTRLSEIIDNDRLAVIEAGCAERLGRAMTIIDGSPAEEQFFKIQATVDTTYLEHIQIENRYHNDAQEQLSTAALLALVQEGRLEEALRMLQGVREGSRLQKGNLSAWEYTTLNQALGSSECSYVTGSTGCGKSSLVEAGVLPHLNAHQTTDRIGELPWPGQPWYLSTFRQEEAEGQEYTFKHYGRDESHSFGDNYLERGDLCEGVIIEIRSNGLLVNVGSKRDGVIPWSDLAKLDPEYVKNLHVGQTIDVVVSKVVGDYEIFQLSIADALQQRDWITAQEMLDSSRYNQEDTKSMNLHVVGMQLLASFRHGQAMEKLEMYGRCLERQFLKTGEKTKQQLEADLSHPFLLLVDGLEEILQSYNAERTDACSRAIGNCTLSESLVELGDSSIYVHEQLLLLLQAVQGIGDPHIIHFPGHGNAIGGAMLIPYSGDGYPWSADDMHGFSNCGGSVTNHANGTVFEFPGKDKSSLVYTINRGHLVARRFYGTPLTDVVYCRCDVNNHAANRQKPVISESAASHLEIDVMQYAIRVDLCPTGSTLDNEALLKQSSGTSCPRVYPCGTTGYQNRQLAIILMVLVGWKTFLLWSLSADFKRCARPVLTTGRHSGSLSTL